MINIFHVTYARSFAGKTKPSPLTAVCFGAADPATDSPEAPGRSFNAHFQLIEAASRDYANSATSFPGLSSERMHLPVGRMREPQFAVCRPISHSAAALIEKTEERWAAAEMHRLRGTLLLAMNQRDAAEVGFNQALAVARQQGAKLWELRAGINLARLWRDDGNPTIARELLAPIYDWFTEGFDTPDLKEATVLLSR